MVSLLIFVIINYAVKKSTIAHSPNSFQETMRFIYPLPTITALMDVSISKRMGVVSDWREKEVNSYGEFADSSSSITLRKFAQ